MCEIKRGFGPVFDENSRLLVLGSFPSVKSRQVQFYYGNPQNRFWRVLCSFFGEDVPQTVEERKSFVLEKHVALWDIVTECEIVASYDSTIKNYKVADIETVLRAAPIELIILNGGTAFSIFRKNYKNCSVPYIALPSTSPANTRFDPSLWNDALARVFRRCNI